MSDNPHATPDRTAIDYLDEWAGWLQRNGFPYDGYTTEPPPPAVVKRLAEIWLEVEQDPELTVWEYAQGFEEYGWKATDD